MSQPTRSKSQTSKPQTSKPQTSPLKSAPLLALLLAPLMGCDVTPAALSARLSGASHLVFRCVDEGSEDSDNSRTPLKTLPLDRCGCVESALSADGARSAEVLSREACLEAHPNARLVGYLASGTQGKVATLSLEGTRQVLDLSDEIPGVSHVATGGLISEMAMHPYGDFLLLVRGSEGLVSLLRDHNSLRPELEVDLGWGPLSSLEVWPKVNEPLPEGGSASYAYVLAPLEDTILELDLDALSLAFDEVARGASAPAPGAPLELSELSSEVITRSWRVSDLEGTGVTLGRLAVDGLGERLVVSHAREPVVSALDLRLSPDEALSARVMARLDTLQGCQDSYLTRLTDASCAPLEAWPEGATPACADGIDNDGDGLIDRADPGCEREDDTTEASIPERSTCADGVDNDRDGAVDLADSDCSAPDTRLGRPSYGEEGELESGVTPVCLDGIDNDGDGLTDAADPGCFDPQAPTRYPFEAPPECADGIDNDGDGLIDYVEASEGEGEGDPSCLFAAGRSESSGQTSLGATHLLATTLELPSGPTSMAYAVSPLGELISINLNALMSPSAQGDASPLKSLPTDGAPLVMELRRTGALATLFYVTQQGNLEALQLTSPEPLSVRGANVYALGELGAEGSVEPVSVAGFYVVREQRAFKLSALEPWREVLSFDERTGIYALPAEAQAALDALTQEELDALEPLELDERAGEGDAQVFVSAGRYPLREEAWNRLRDAVGQTPRATSASSLSISEVPTRFNPERHVGLCAEVSAEGARENGCTLASSEVGVSGPDSTYLKGYEGLTLTPAPLNERPTFLSLLYEGELPNSRSRSGAMVRGDEASWELVDYEADFCSLGVEVGDLLIADRFYPYDEEAASDPACEPYLKRTPNEGLYPLRYRVVEVRQRGLTLEADTRESFAPQVGPNAATLAPSLATPLAPPPYRCAAQEIAYVVRARADDWLVVTSEGYRHPWMSSEGRCVERARDVQAGKVGRARLGEPYVSDWVHFTIGYQAQASGASGVPAGRAPFMVGARLDVALSTGALSRRLAGVGALPTALRWLPELDRLYIVDAALQSATELDQLDPYLGSLRQIQTFE